MAGFNPKWIVGKTVASVDMQTQEHLECGRIGVFHEPIIYFADGSSIAFSTEETEIGVYGTDIIYCPARKD